MASVKTITPCSMHHHHHNDLMTMMPLSESRTSQAIFHAQTRRRAERTSRSRGRQQWASTVAQQTSKQRADISEAHRTSRRRVHVDEHWTAILWRQSWHQKNGVWHPEDVGSGRWNHIEHQHERVDISNGRRSHSRHRRRAVCHQRGQTKPIYILECHWHIAWPTRPKRQQKLISSHPRLRTVHIKGSSQQSAPSQYFIDIKHGRNKMGLFKTLVYTISLFLCIMHFYHTQAELYVFLAKGEFILYNIILLKLHSCISPLHQRNIYVDKIIKIVFKKFDHKHFIDIILDRFDFILHMLDHSILKTIDQHPL